MNPKLSRSTPGTSYEEDVAGAFKFCLPLGGCQNRRGSKRADPVAALDEAWVAILASSVCDMTHAGLCVLSTCFWQWHHAEPEAIIPSYVAQHLGKPGKPVNLYSHVILIAWSLSCARVIARVIATDISSKQI